MKSLIIVSRLDGWPQPSDPAVEVVTAQAYLTDPRLAAMRGARVVNLCRSYQYQTTGYYVSLLAMARGHKIVPTVSATQDVKGRAYLRLVGEEIEAAIVRAFAGISDERPGFELFFGHPDDERYARLGAQLFGLLQLPLMKVRFHKHKGSLRLDSVTAIAPEELDDAGKARAMRFAEAYLTRGATQKKLKNYRYELAILHDPAEVDTPSQPATLNKFRRAAERMGVRCELIQRDDFGRLSEFDGLFIRTTTAVSHYTYRFARRAAAEGLAVIDDPDSILRCTNKVYLAELLARNGVPHPKTRIISKDTLNEAIKELDIPVVLKKPDGSFSLGVEVVKSREALEEAARRMLERSSLILAQEFIPTAYDWRIGVLGGRALFACRYYMAKGHWQIIKRSDSGRETFGNADTIPIEDAPPAVVNTAVRAASLIGDGLYGVDLKEIDGRVVVIEINDNPNLDAGVEDKVLGRALYDAVVGELVRRMEARRDGARR